MNFDEFIIITEVKQNWNMSSSLFGVVPFKSAVFILFRSRASGKKKKFLTDPLTY